MKISNDAFTHHDTVELSRIEIEYLQPLDSCQSEKEYDCQILTICTDDAGGGKFFRLKTNDAGWSFDNIEELISVLEDFKQRSSCND